MEEVEQMIERGLQAEALLTAPTFQAALVAVMDNYANTILLTKPHERQTREDNYHLHRALNDVVAQLGSWITTKDEIIAAAALKEQQENE
jgi:hypothetical protein